MYKFHANTIETMHYMIVVVWLVFSLTTGTAYCDTPSAQRSNALHQSLNNKIKYDIQYNGLKASSSLCIFKSGIQYSKYLKAPLTFHESFFSAQTDSEPPRADLLAIFKLALDEFDFLSGVRIYWKYTERNIEKLSIKLKLKGEIFFSDSYYRSSGQPLKDTRRSKRNVSEIPLNSIGMPSLFKPQIVKWNLGINPDDSTVFGDLHLNSHLRFSGELGDENQIGLYFRWSF